MTLQISRWLIKITYRNSRKERPLILQNWWDFSRFLKFEYTLWKKIEGMPG